MGSNAQLPPLKGKDMQEEYDKLMELYNSLKRQVRQADPHLYERWKAGGYLIDDDILSMYPTLGKCVEQLADGEDTSEDLVKLASDNGWTVPTLCQALDINHDRTNNGGLKEVIELALKDDDEEWIHDIVSNKPN